MAPTSVVGAYRLGVGGLEAVCPIARTRPAVASFALGPEGNVVGAVLGSLGRVAAYAESASVVGMHTLGAGCELPEAAGVGEAHTFTSHQPKAMEMSTTP